VGNASAFSRWPTHAARRPRHVRDRSRIGNRGAHIVLLPASILINNAILASNDQRLKVEADNLATANLEKVQQEAQSGPLSGGTTSFTYQSRSGSQYTVFTVTTQFTPLSESGGVSSFTTVCQNGGATQLQIWSVTATVRWQGMRGARPVTVTTDVAPGEAGAADLLDGEIAIPVNGVNGTPISTPINYYVTRMGPEPVPGSPLGWPQILPTRPVCLVSLAIPGPRLWSRDGAAGHSDCGLPRHSPVDLDGRAEPEHHPCSRLRGDHRGE